MRISVIIPVFNGERTIRAAIDSALAQDFDGKEIIVVDDGSTDSTRRILESYGSQIKFITQSNRGVSAARNACVAASSGKYIALLDADDTWLPNKLARTVSRLDANPDAALAFSDFISVDRFGVQGSASCLGKAPSMQELMTRAWGILPSTVVMRRSVLDKIGGFCEEFKGSGGGDDTYIWILTRECGEFEYVAAPLATYRTSDASSMADKYAAGQDVFVRLIRARYGERALPLIDDSHRFYSSLLVIRALGMIDQGNIRGGLSAWAHAVRHRPAMLLESSTLSRFFVAKNLRRLVKGIAIAGRGSSAAP
jgi:glycosyltransferase involved in cell wall biosynthesis